MDIAVQPGTYVVAVSGGVDSMVLLDVLRQYPGLKLVVAHFDHGIRPDASLDRQLVQEVARRHGLPFVYHEGQLGPEASEEAARKARYEFLHKVRVASGARAIITAHHHDDAMETAVINLLRGTGRKGLSSLRSRANVHRPLLHISKQQLQQYAAGQGLVWREDSTNSNMRYLRNHVRQQLLPKFSAADQKTLRDTIARVGEINDELDMQLLHYLHVQPVAGTLDRPTFLRLPHSVACEVMAAWLRNHGVRAFDEKALNRLVVGVKTLPAGKSIDIVQGHRLVIGHERLALRAIDR